MAFFIDGPLRRQKEDAHDFLRALQLVQYLLEVRCPLQLLGLLVVAGAGGAGEGRLLAPQGVQSDSGPFALVVRSGLGRTADFLQGVKSRRKSSIS